MFHKAKPDDVITAPTAAVRAVAGMYRFELTAQMLSASLVRLGPVQVVSLASCWHCTDGPAANNGTKLQLLQQLLCWVQSRAKCASRMSARY